MKKNAKKSKTKLTTRWIEVDYDIDFNVGTYKCEQCCDLTSTRWIKSFKYCPCCGAKAKGIV